MFSQGNVRDRCHIKIKTGIKTIPVISHKLKGYPSQLIMQQTYNVTGNITCIRSDTERYCMWIVWDYLGIKLIYWEEDVYILMNILTLGINLIEKNYLELEQVH